MTAILELKSVSRRFGGLVANDSIDMSVDPGEVRGLIGPNGAGKSTLLNLIGGQLIPSSGQISYEGVAIGGMSVDKRAAIGIRRTFQNLKLFRDMTVLDNVKVGLHTAGSTEIIGSILRTRKQREEEQECARKAELALGAVGLQGLANAPASSLPYGHRRLLEIARALACGPRILLLDEPAAGLSSTEAVALVELIRKIAEKGISVILVEHHMDVVMRSCNRVTVLNYGKLLAEGTPAEVQQNPGVITAYLGKRANADEAAHA